MENSVSLSYMTRGNSNPRGKSKVYFSYHPGDRVYLGHISNLLFEKYDYAVYYYDYEHLGEPDTEKLGALLDEMQLVVIPITSKYLNQPSVAFSFELKYAKEHHIPILPLLQSSDLAQEFNEKCGNLQFMDEYSEDNTAISFDEKLGKFLSEALIGTELLESIRKDFRAYVFLSYRKKDREYAQKLMRLIHEDPRCRDIAIWYDEFLVAGEPFDTAIMDALSKSDLFTLIVTPNLMNGDNYVKRHEYPAARKENKPILAVESVTTDRELLEESFTDITQFIYEGDGEKITDELLNKLNITAQKDDNPKHMYLMGLAYLNGIDVERNPEMGANLITSAAESGYSDARKMLSLMYYNGIGVDRSIEESVLWQERYIAGLTEEWAHHLEKTPKEELDFNRAETLLSEMFFLIHAYNEVSDIEQAEKAISATISLSEHFSTLRPDLFRYYLATSYTIAADFYSVRNQPTKTEDYYMKSMTVQEKLVSENPELYYGDLARIYIDIGAFYHNQGQTSETEEYTLRGVDIFERLAAENPDQNNAYLALSYNNAGIYYNGQGQAEKAEDYFLKTIALREKLSDEDPVYDAPLAESYNIAGAFYECQGQFEKAEEFYLKALVTLEELAEHSPEKFNADLAKCCNTIYLFYTYKMGVANTEEYLFKSIEVYEKLAAENPERFESELAQSYLFAGNYYSEHGEPAQAEEFLLKSIEISEKLVDENPEQYSDFLVASYNVVCLFYSSDEDSAEAEKYYLKAIEMSEKLAAEDPERYSGNLATSYFSAAAHFEDMGEFEKIEEYCLKALSIYEKLSEDNNEKYAACIALIYKLLVESYDEEEAGAEDAAKHEEFCLKAIGVYEKMVEQNPEQYHSDLSDFYQEMAYLYRRGGRRKEEEEFYLKAVAMYERLNAENPGMYIELLKESYRDAIRYYKAMGKPIKAWSYKKKEKSLRRKM